jgi:predicted ATP-dependent protease
MTEQVKSQADNTAKDTQVVDANTQVVDVNKQDQKLTPEVMAEEMRQARAEAARYRTERNDLTKQIDEFKKKAEKGSELEKSLTEFSARLEIAEKRASFFEDAVRPGIDCRNPKVAYALAVTDNLFDRKGSPDWTALKEAAPELFGKVTPPANAGTGTGNPPKNNDMNAFIRTAAGRG